MVHNFAFVYEDLAYFAALKQQQTKKKSLHFRCWLLCSVQSAAQVVVRCAVTAS